jgi:hypothetical protein
MVEYLERRANGETQKEAALRLGLSVPGARRLDAESRLRLGCATTAQAVAAAIARGLLVTVCCLLVVALQAADMAQLTSDIPELTRRVPGKRRGDSQRGGGKRGGPDSRRGGSRKAGRQGAGDDGGPLAVATGPDWGAIGRPGPGLAADDLAGRLADDAVATQAALDDDARAALALAVEREATA